MFARHFLSCCLAAALTVSGVGRADADAGDAIAGALVGGIIGHAIAKDQQRRRAVTVQRSAPRATGISSAQRASNQQMQTALNYFGFNAGSVDGAVGPGTRGAVSRYQAQLGYPASGWIQPHERDFLLAAYGWATTGGAATTAASSPQELLVAYRRVVTGGPQMALTAPAPMQMAPPTTTVVVAPQAAPPAEEPAPKTTLAAAEETPSLPALPNFMGESGAPSLASHCNKVSLVTNSNGGFVTEATLTDAGFALEEQFCLARTYAIALGEDLASKVQGFTPQQISAQCDSFGPAMRDYVAALSLQPRDEVLREVAGFVLESGMSPAQLAGTAKICLSVGYRTDDMDVALGSALLLVALGEGVYGELMGHHLAHGFGASKRSDLALAWYEIGLGAVSNGSPAVFAPGQPARQSLIRKAALKLGGAAEEASAPAETPVPLPAFAIQE